MTDPRWLQASGIGQIEQMLLGQGNGARAIVYGARADGSAHVFNAVVQGGQVRYIDFQSGRGAVLEEFVYWMVISTTP